MADRYPGARSFYKYATPETAIAVLQNRTVRYSSPLTYNDPFDVQTGLHFDFDPDQLHEKLIDFLEKFASGSEVLAINQSNPWGELALIARRKYPRHGFDKQRWLDMTAPDFNESLLPIIKETRLQYQQYWHNSLATMRVFCVSEERDNLLMWAHYAQDHTGVVFEFLSRPEDDNVLSIAQKVEYVSSPPPFFTEQEWLESVFITGGFDAEALHRRYVLRKSMDWNYEKEWRVWYPDASPDSPHDFMPIRDNELPRLFIGCRAASEFSSEIIELARTSFPNIKIFKANRRTDAYRLDYTEV
ncbi:DUF2971 domain-containing protein [Pseudomonas sp. NPDC086251]|uniref:DUF2971 domain-containing protein n=1 Tax=Pseudomonas sp. NPDC086251 TaxID=3364431 RepID=UPI003834855F